eukprot:UN06335
MFDLGQKFSPMSLICPRKLRCDEPFAPYNTIFEKLNEHLTRRFT